MHHTSKLAGLVWGALLVIAVAALAQRQSPFGMSVRVEGSHEAVVSRVKQILKAEGFGVITEMGWFIPPGSQSDTFNRSLTVAVRSGAAAKQYRDRKGAVFVTRLLNLPTEIDVKATMKEKLGLDVEPYRIIGACNPKLAHRALTAEPEVGLLLPCNVIVYRQGDAVIGSAVDPTQRLGESDNATLRAVAREVRARLIKVVRQLGE